MSFSNDIKKFSDKTNKNCLFVLRATAIDLFTRIIRRTPVDTGRLRGNWYASLNRPSDAVDAGGQGYEAIALKAKADDSIFLVNNLPYAKAIEDGHSDQAPVGMVKVTVEEFEMAVKKIVRKIK